MKKKYSESDSGSMKGYDPNLGLRKSAGKMKGKAQRYAPKATVKKKPIFKKK